MEQILIGVPDDIIEQLWGRRQEVHGRDLNGVKLLSLSKRWGREHSEWHPSTVQYKTIINSLMYNCPDTIFEEHHSFINPFKTIY